MTPDVIEKNDGVMTIYPSPLMMPPPGVQVCNIGIVRHDQGHVNTKQISCLEFGSIKFRTVKNAESLT